MNKVFFCFILTYITGSFVFPLVRYKQYTYTLQAIYILENILLNSESNSILRMKFVLIMELPFHHFLHQSYLLLHYKLKPVKQI